MAYYNKEDLINKVNDWVKANGNNEITGNSLQEILRDILDSVSFRSLKETTIISPAIVGNHTITLVNTPIIDDEFVLVFYDGVLMEEGVGNDYIIVNRDIIFQFVPTLNMKVVVIYKTINII